jgi:hypothetical protein
MPDLLEDTIKKVGESEPIKDKAQPSDLTNKNDNPNENGEQDQPSQPTDTQGGEKPESQKTDDAQSKEDAQIDEQVLDTIINKVEKGEDLSDEEQQIYERVLVEQAEKPEEPTPEVPKFNIAGNEYSYDDLRVKMREAYRIGNIKLSEEGEKNLVEAYVKNQNRTAQQRAVEDRQRQVVTERHDLERDKTATMEMRRANEQRAIQLEAQRQQLENEKKVLEREKNRLLKLANQGLTKDDLYDEEQRLDPDKQHQYNKQLDAKERLTEITEREREIQSSEENNQKELSRTQIFSFIADHPEYEPSEDIDTILEKINKGYEINEQDEKKLLELDDFARESSTKGLPIEKVYRLHKARGTLAVKPAEAQTSTERQGGKPPLPELPSRTKEAADLIRSYKKKMQLAGSSVGGGGYGRGTQAPQKTDAEKLLDAGRKARGVEKDSFTRDELGY